MTPRAQRDGRHRQAGRALARGSRHPMRRGLAPRVGQARRAAFTSSIGAIAVQAESLIHWPEPIVEYVGFVAQFLAVGAVGFRYAAVRDRLTSDTRAGAGEGDRG